MTVNLSLLDLDSSSAKRCVNARRYGYRKGMTDDEKPDDRPVGDTPEAHDEIIPEDLPEGHPGRAEAERQAAEGDGKVRGNT